MTAKVIVTNDDGTEFSVALRLESIGYDPQYGDSIVFRDGSEVVEHLGTRVHIIGTVVPK